MPPLILIVEDEVILADSIAIYLECHAYATAVAYTGEDGLRLAAENNPDVAVVDLRLPGLDLQLLGRAIQHERVALRRDPDISHLPSPLRRTHVGLECVVRPVRGSDERAAALENRVERLLLQHLLSVERRNHEAAGHRVRPAGRNRAVGVRIEVFGPWKGMGNTGACLASQSTNGCLDDARLLDRLVGDRDGSVSHDAFEAFEGPRGFFFTQETAGGIERSRVQLHRLTGLE